MGERRIEFGKEGSNESRKDGRKWGKLRTRKKVIRDGGNEGEGGERRKKRVMKRKKNRIKREWEIQ